MALSADKRIETVKTNLNVKKVAPATAGTFYVGEILMISPADKLVKPVSASTEPGTNIVGVVTEQQVISTAGDNLKFEAGYFVMSGSGFTHAEMNKLAWAEDSDTVYDAQGTNRQVIGRFKGFTAGSDTSNNAIFEVGQVPSGSSI